MAMPPKDITPKAVAKRIGEKKPAMAIKRKAAEAPTREVKRMGPLKELLPKTSKSPANPKGAPKGEAKRLGPLKPMMTKAEKGIAKELSPKGVKAAEKMQKGAIDKKYPGMFKKSGK